MRVGGTGSPSVPTLLLSPSPQGLQGFQGDRGLSGEKGEEVSWLLLLRRLVLWARLGASPSPSMYTQCQAVRAFHYWYHRYHTSSTWYPHPPQHLPA